jgi:hypothetical protein
VIRWLDIYIYIYIKREREKTNNIKWNKIKLSVLGLGQVAYL